jgi:hypothetical protein
MRHPTRAQGAFVTAKSGNGVLNVHVEDIAQNTGESAASMKIKLRRGGSVLAKKAEQVYSRAAAFGQFANFS